MMAATDSRKKQRVRFGLEELREEDNRHEHQEPQQRHVTYLFKQRSHLAASPDLRLAIRLCREGGLTYVKE
jgi:hypothetical protein